MRPRIDSRLAPLAIGGIGFSYSKCEGESLVLRGFAVVNDGVITPTTGRTVTSFASNSCASW